MRGKLSAFSAQLSAFFGRLADRDRAAARLTRGQMGDTGWYYTKLTPAQVRSLLAGMRAGDFNAAYELFSEMQDTWHTLAKNLQQLREAVAAVPYNVVAYSKAGETSPAAAERAAFCRYLLKDFTPDPVTDENGFEDFIYDLTDALVLGINVQEILWERTDDGEVPRATVWVHPNQYAIDPADGRLKLNTAGVLTDFPPDKFLVATYKTRSGARAMNGLLRPLAWWWCAVQFGRDWVLRNAELFGQPFRDIEYDPNIKPEDLAELKDMAAHAGNCGWIVRPAGSKLTFIEAQKTGDASPQAELLDRADTACDLMILWQTLTSQTGPTGGGSLALGEVHGAVLEARKQNIARWVANVISYQLFPAILRKNYGDDAECPVCVAATAKPEDPKAKADRLAVIKTLVPVPKRWLYEQLEVPEPEEGEAVIGGPSSGQLSAVSGQPFAESRELKAESSSPTAARAAVTGSAQEKLAAASRQLLDRSLAADLAPVRQRIEVLLALDDDAAFAAELAALQRDLPTLLPDQSQAVTALAKVLGAATLNGLAEARSSAKGRGR